tara:strand:- start:17329 stop:17739 length:411 start_codon:yes stop_codon:yes gene_type:complete
MMTGEQFADNLRNGANGLNEYLALKLLSLGNKIWAASQENFTGNTGESGYLIGPRSITGNLRGSINADVVLTPTGPELMITAGKVKPVLYAAAIEFGAPKRNIEERMFIGRAFEEILADVPGDLSNVLNVAILDGE